MVDYIKSAVKKDTVKDIVLLFKKLLFIIYLKIFNYDFLNVFIL